MKPRSCVLKYSTQSQYPWLPFWRAFWQYLLRKGRHAANRSQIRTFLLLALFRYWSDLLEIVYPANLLVFGYLPFVRLLLFVFHYFFLCFDRRGNVIGVLEPFVGSSANCDRHVICRSRIFDIALLRAFSAHVFNTYFLGTQLDILQLTRWVIFGLLACPHLRRNNF